jgi:hypothetical protein
MARFVSKDLPFRRLFHDDVGSSNGLVVLAGGCGSTTAKLATPRKTNSRIGSAGGQEGPVRIVVLEAATPFGETIQAV